MENAPKALLMAGGILIALLVIGALLLMFNQLSSYQKTNSDVEKQSQLVEFNNQFIQYTHSNIQGYELLTLINKVIDYNGNDGVANSVDYSKKITLTISGLNTFNTKFAYKDEPGTNKLFKADSYIIRNKGDEKELTDALNDCMSAEAIIDSDELKSIAGLYKKSDTKKENVERIRERLCELFPDSGYENWDGEKNTSLKLTTIIKYIQYSEFKTATFKVNENPTYYDNGQVETLSFKFKE